MRVTTTNRTSKLQAVTRPKTSSTTILNEQTGHLQNGTTIVSPTLSTNVIEYSYIKNQIFISMSSLGHITFNRCW